MSALWVWFIAAAVLVGAELLTGTFYLLAVGAAFAIGGVAASVGLSMQVQLIIAGIAAVLLVWAAHHWRARKAKPEPQPSLDLGQSVRVQGWNPDGSARVSYRGSQWTAVLATPETPRAETMFIVATRGSVLVVADRRG